MTISSLPGYGFMDKAEDGWFAPAGIVENSLLELKL